MSLLPGTHIPSRLLVVIVNYRTADLVIDCLRSLEPEVRALGGTSVAVVDNASGDGSADRVAEAIEREQWQDWAISVPLEHNGGFSYGNNAVIRPALAAARPPQYILLLNPDTVVQPGALAELVRFSDERPEVGAIGGRLEEPDGQPQCSAHQMITPFSELLQGARFGVFDRCLPRAVVSPPVRDEPHECDWLSGACLLIRREVFDQVNLLDEGYFLYFDEVDYCLRVRRAGWPIWYVPTARVVHLEGQATGISQLAKRRSPYWYASRRRFFVKSYGVLGLIAADIAWACGRTTLALRRLLRLGGSTDHEPRHYALDLLWGDLRAILRGEVFQVRKMERTR